MKFKKGMRLGCSGTLLWGVFLTPPFRWARGGLCLLCVSVLLGGFSELEAESPGIMTVTGLVPAAELGPALTHEHLFSTFRMSASEAKAAFDREAIFVSVVPRLKAARSQGVDVIFECTAANFGRDVSLLRRLSQASGVRIVTNTGLYGAAKGFHLSEEQARMTADQLAEQWVAEFKHGIAGTGIRPGFIKVGVDPGPLSAIDATLVRAAARTHAATGLVVASHTGGSVEAAEAQLTIFRKEGVAPSAWIWTHTHQVKDRDALLEAARAGAWISLDGLSEQSVDQILESLSWLREEGLLNRVLFSHDGNAFPVSGMAPRGFDLLYGPFLERLRESGLDDQDIRQITVLNPRTAFAIRKRLLPATDL